VKVRIEYQTQYRYAEPVSFSPHVFRLFPRVDHHLRIHSHSFQTNADAVISYRRDLFDNEIASCFYPNASALLGAQLGLEIELQPTNPFAFLLDSHAIEIPFDYTAEERRVLLPYLGSKPAPMLGFWTPPREPVPTMEALVELNAAIHRNLDYERRDEGDAHPPEETLRLRRGACRDLAVLLAEVLRGLGLGARLASGYLCEFGDADKVAEGSLHAWVETYLPGAGWIGFDPTNGTLCNHHHLTAAVGLTPFDVSPVFGRYYHPSRVPAKMSAMLKIIPHA
jgi:transglutaminase-like putative cysteine protease